MTELLIVGGGIMGLWAGVMAERAGLKTVIAERDTVGAGASGGVLGALMPYMPDKWDAKKQLQFDALLSLENEIATLEGETGLSAGYRRSGRIIPLPKPHLRAIALRHEQDALSHWRAGERQFHWHVRDRSGMTGWPEASYAQNGIVFDTLAARVDPRPLLGLLKEILNRSRHVRIEEGQDLVRLDLPAGRAYFAGGQEKAFGACILAAGVESFGFLDRLSLPPAKPSGRPIKGQAALVRADVDPTEPVIFADGLYVVPHENGMVGIGSTSETQFDAPFSTDDQLDALLRKAVLIAPALRDAPVIERWAGLRPRPSGLDPMVGRHPDHTNLFMLTGGFKISFGLAHLLAENTVRQVIEKSGEAGLALPETFRCSTHVEKLR